MQGGEGVGGLGRGGGGRSAAEMVAEDKGGSEQTELSEVRDTAGKEDSCMADPFLELEMRTNGSAGVFATVCVTPKTARFGAFEHKGKAPWAGWRGLFSSADPQAALRPRSSSSICFLSLRLTYVAVPCNFFLLLPLKSLAGPCIKCSNHIS